MKVGWCGFIINTSEKTMNLCALCSSAAVAVAIGQL